ncbi:DUF1876 domain-containing protein [Actinopolymorpha pittospori]|uniref:DUF1876 domain-containing protein n=1 Tax=Actinopolymorpha pittospori TaxID=648752 RepID=A0A927RCB6_9ACTN|nr:DUF1876 domain-containing protein [Actinopolymorpha pittospori]MBE1609724.1 hypothetical protein [Actinopolymorpha pittospori]
MSDTKQTTKHWNVEISIDEENGQTRAEAFLVSPDKERLTGMGRARCNPADADVPKIGDELAVARALAELSHRLLHTAADDIEGITAQPARLDY